MRKHSRNQTLTYLHLPPNCCFELSSLVISAILCANARSASMTRSNRYRPFGFCERNCALRSP
ncbi:unnamed protein product [Bathycoccus prasinos]